MKRTPTPNYLIMNKCKHYTNISINHSYLFSEMVPELDSVHGQNQSLCRLQTPPRPLLFTLTRRETMLTPPLSTSRILQTTHRPPLSMSRILQTMPRPPLSPSMRKQTMPRRPLSTSCYYLIFTEIYLNYFFSKSDI